MCWALCRGSGKDQVLCSPRQKLYKKDLHDPDNHNGVITHSPRARNPGMQSQVSLRKLHYGQS